MVEAIDIAQLSLSVGRACTITRSVCGYDSGKPYLAHNPPFIFSSGRNHNGQECLHHEKVSSPTHHSLHAHTLSLSLHSFDQYRPPSQEKPYIDVWPMCVHFNEEFDNTFTMLLQLACVIHMKDKDKMISHSRIRIFVVVDSSE